MKWELYFEAYVIKESESQLIKTLLRILMINSKQFHKATPKGDSNSISFSQQNLSIVLKTIYTLNMGEFYQM